MLKKIMDVLGLSKDKKTIFPLFASTRGFVHEKKNPLKKLVAKCYKITVQKIQNLRYCTHRFYENFSRILQKVSEKRFE